MAYISGTTGLLRGYLPASLVDDESRSEHTITTAIHEASRDTL